MTATTLPRIPLLIFSSQDNYLGDSAMWLGAKVKSSDSSFHWLEEPELAVDNTWTRWDTKEPKSGDECVILPNQPNAKWKSENCAAVHSFVCKRPIMSTTQDVLPTTDSE